MGRRALVAILCAFACACAKLADLNADGRCGNAIIEDAEECDSFGECGAPGTAHECRLVCVTSTAACPLDMRCGTDRVCRAPSGTFDPSPMLRLRDRPGARLADFDGNGIPDLVSERRSELVIDYSDFGSAFGDARSFGIGVASLQFAGRSTTLGDLDVDGRTDLLLSRDSGVHVLLGTEERTLSPIAALLSSQQAPAVPAVKRIVLPSNDGGATDDLLEIRPTMLAAVIDTPLIPAASASFPELSHVGSEDAVDVDGIAHADLDGDGGDELAVHFTHGRRVFIYRSGCGPSISGGRRCTPELEAIVEVPGLFESRGEQCASFVLFTDADADGRVDLLANGLSNSFEEVAIAYGDGHGHFCDRPVRGGDCAAAGGTIDRAAPSPALSELDAPAFICAAADFDGNGLTDYVTSRSNIFIATSTSTFRFALAVESAPELGDFNGDRITDLFFVEDFGVRFLTGTPRGVFSETRVSSPGKITSFAAGDFDGDLFGDLAISSLGSSVRMLFGGPRGVREEPVSVATVVGEVDAMVAGNFIGRRGLIVDDPRAVTPDLENDLVVFSSHGAEPEITLGTTVLAGSGDRRMLSTSAVPLRTPALYVPIQILVGRLGEALDVFPDLLITALMRPDNVLEEPYYFLAQGDGAGRFSLQQSFSLLTCRPFSDQPSACTHQLVAPEGAGRDEVVGIVDDNCRGQPGWVRALGLADAAECRDRGQFTGSATLIRAELDHDGREDLFVFHGQREIEVYRSPFFTSSPVTPSTPAGEPVGAIDLGGDRTKELLFSTAPGELKGLRLAGSDLVEISTFESSAFPRSFRVLSQPELFTDFDGDGIEDLVVEDQTSMGTILVFRQLPENP